MRLGLRMRIPVTPKTHLNVSRGGVSASRKFGDQGPTINTRGGIYQTLGRGFFLRGKI